MRPEKFAPMRAGFLMWLAPGALAVFARGAGSSPAREYQRTFPVQPGCTLVVDTYHGEIVIEESDQSEVRVTLNVDFEVETEAEAERFWAGLDCRFSADGQTVSIVARNPVATGPRLSWDENKRMNLYYRISVPRQCDLRLKTGMGRNTVGRLAGRMSARVDTGTIFFRQVDGSIDAAVDTGEVVISRCSGDVSVRVREGTIRVGTIGGRAELRNSRGGIDVMVAKGALTALAKLGDISVNFPRQVSQPASLTAAGGNMNVQIDPAAHCEVDASATWGRVRNTLPLTGAAVDREARRVTGRLNQGGPLLKIRADGGSVSLVPGEAPFE